MKNGHLIIKGLQADVIDSIKEKVFELEIDSTALPAFKEKRLVVNAIRKKDKVLVRYIGEGEIGDALYSPVSLEDAYLFLTKNNRYEYLPVFS